MRECKTCVHWQRANDSKSKEAKYGSCRYNTPSVFYANNYPASFFPLTEEREWCSRYECGLNDADWIARNTMQAEPQQEPGKQPTTSATPESQQQ
jgi:hypothetical protein